MRLGRDGTSSIEFAIVAVVFFNIIFATMDLGRYFITQHSLRTLTSELIRATMVQCVGNTAACQLNGANVTAAEAKAPFLAAANFAATPTATRSAADTNGVMTITASASYAFQFVFPVFSGLNGNITDAIQLSY